jgi:signal transduction histidine kinase
MSRAIGKGWNVLTPIISRDNVSFAVMSNDSAISGAPLDEEQQNLLAVYCSLLGNIAERKHLETQLQAEAAKMAAATERSRLARELHDSVSQALFGIARGARTAQEQLNHPSEYSRERVAAPINYVLDLSQAALAEMRALIFELRPESLQTEGLIAAFEKQAAALYARHRILVNTQLGEQEPPLDMARKEALYRIGLEAIQNTIKHAHATQVDLCLSVGQNTVTMDVRDNGLGFNTTEEFPGHLGLQTMRERAEELGGTFAVASQPNQGTLVQVVLPLAKNAKNANGHKSSGA